MKQNMNYMNMFKIFFDVLFRPAFSQALLKDMSLGEKTHIAVTACVSVCVLMCLCHVISSVGKAINILLMFLLPPLMELFCMLTVLFLMFALDFKGFLQDNLNT